MRGPLGVYLYVFLGQAGEGFDDAVSEIPDSATLGDVQLALQNALEGFFGAVGPALDTRCPAAE